MRPPAVAPLALIALVLLAGCATVPPESGDPLTASQATSLPSSPTRPDLPATPEIPPSPPTLPVKPDGGFVDSFDTDPRLAPEWRIGTWDLDRDVGGRLTWTEGEVRMRAITPAFEEGYGTGPVLGMLRDARFGSAGVVIEATVTPHKLFRYGITLVGEDAWASVEVDDFGMCLCTQKATGWEVETFAPTPAPNTTVTIRLTLLPEGRAHGMVLDAEGSILSEGNTDGVLLAPEEVVGIAVGVWTDEASNAASDYTTHRVAAWPL